MAVIRVLVTVLAVVALVASVPTRNIKPNPGNVIERFHHPMPGNVIEHRKNVSS